MIMNRMAVLLVGSDRSVRCSCQHDERPTGRSTTTAPWRRKNRTPAAGAGRSLIAGRDLADLDAAPFGRRALGRDRERLGLAVAVEQEEPADHLLGLGERA